MGVKLLGAVLLLLAGAGTGWQFAARLGQRVKELGSLGLALRVLEREVTVGATPLPVALERSAQVAGPSVADLLGHAAGRLSDGSGCTASQAWEEACARTPLCLTVADLEVLRGLGVTLGTSGRADQARHIALTRERLATREQSAREEAERQGKLYRYLGILVPLALLLALW
ncbi:MAG: stage III sporulation protein AB [Bacillota bacterium]